MDVWSIKCVLVEYFGKGDYKVLEQSTGWMFQFCNVHRILSEAHSGPATDLFDVFEVPVANQAGIANDKTNNDHRAVDPPSDLIFPLQWQRHQSH